MNTSLRLLTVVVFSFIAGNTVAASPRDLVTRAVEAMGGEAALSRLQTIAIRGQNNYQEIESSYQPGQKAEPRKGSESTFLTQRDFASGASRIDWDRRIVRVSPPQVFKFSEVMAGGIGYVSGIDAPNRIQASLSSNPPGHAMSGARAAVTLRELTRQSPRLLLDMKNNPKAVSAIAAQTVDGKSLPAVRYNVRDWSFIVIFDPETRLPARIRTRDGDAVQGDSNFDLVLADWRAVDGARIAHSLTYKLNGRDLFAIKYDQVTANPALGAGLFEIPFAARATAAPAAMGTVPYQWILRRHFWASHTDSDTIAWDVGAIAEPTLIDIAPGVSQSQGVTHNSVVVEMDKYLVVFEAPIHEQLSEWTIREAKKRYPGKPIKYLLLTHHHWDHTSGARTYIAEGATVIVGKGQKEHFARMFSARGTILNDRLQRHPRKANIIEVNGKYVLKDGKREIDMYLIDTQHSIGTLIAYIPDAKLGFVTDLWNTNAKLGAKPTQSQLDLIAGVKKWGIMPEKFAAGHGNVTPFSTLLKVAGG